jgi:hypothetical protein
MGFFPSVITKKYKDGLYFDHLCLSLELLFRDVSLSTVVSIIPSVTSLSRLSLMSSVVHKAQMNMTIPAVKKSGIILFPLITLLRWTHRHGHWSSIQFFFMDFHSI